MPTKAPWSRRSAMRNMASMWPREMMSGLALGLIAARMALILRALSSYMAIDTCSPAWRRPMLPMTSKLPMWAPIKKAP